MVITDDMKSQESLDLFLKFARKRVDHVDFEDFKRYVNWLGQESDKKRSFNYFWFIAYLTGIEPQKAANDYFLNPDEEKLENRFKRKEKG